MKSDLKGKRIGMVDPNPWPTKKPMNDTSAVINFVIHGSEPAEQPMKKAKRDKYSFLDGLYGRGKGRAKSQNYAQHFKR